MHSPDPVSKNVCLPGGHHAEDECSKSPCTLPRTRACWGNTPHLGQRMPTGEPAETLRKPGGMVPADRDTELEPSANATDDCTDRRVVCTSLWSAWPSSGYTVETTTSTPLMPSPTVSRVFRQ